MKNAIICFPLGIALFLLTSCINTKDYIYLQHAPIAQGSLTVFQNAYAQYRIQPDDILSVRVKALDTKNAAVFNLENEGGVTQVNPGFTYLNGYSVNESGEIVLPIIGSVQVGGLTIAESQQKIQLKLDRYLKEASVLVSLVSFKVSVLGEVSNPGQFYVYNNRLTLFEAISMAGDLTDFANRRRVNLIRQTPEGSVGTLLDLTQAGIIESPYYYLSPNDVIYVEPMKIKSKRSNMANTQILNSIFVGLSTLTTVFVLLIKK